MSDSSAEKKLGSIETVSYFANQLLEQTDLLSSLSIKDETDRIGNTFFLPWSIVESSKALHLLAKNNYGNEVYVLLRGLIEKIITFYYLQACSDQEFDNYIKYSRQKTIWKMNQSLSAGDKRFEIKYVGDFDLDEFSDLKEAKEQFTSKKGRPITRWSPTSIEKKLELIQKENVVDIDLLLLATVSFYDDGSEALHATMYGCLFHLGTFRLEAPAKSEAEFVSKHHANLSSIFFVTSNLLGQLTEYISNKRGFDEEKENARALKKRAIKYMHEVLNR